MPSVAFGSGLSAGHAEATRAGRDASSRGPRSPVPVTYGRRVVGPVAGPASSFTVGSDAWCELLLPGWRTNVDTVAIGSPEPIVMHLKRQIRSLS